MQADRSAFLAKHGRRREDVRATMPGRQGRATTFLRAGGAFLEWLEGKTLPGVAALEPA
jgi:hypothetical protein